MAADDDDAKRKGKQKVVYEEPKTVYEKGESSRSTSRRRANRSRSSSLPSRQVSSHDLNLALSSFGTAPSSFSIEPPPKRPKLAIRSSSKSPPSPRQTTALGPRMPLSSIPTADKRPLFNGKPRTQRSQRPPFPSSLIEVPLRYPDAPSLEEAFMGPTTVPDWSIFGMELKQQAMFEEAKIPKTSRVTRTGRSLHGPSPLKPGPPPHEIVKKAVTGIKAFVNQLAYAKAYYGRSAQPPKSSDPPVTFSPKISSVLPFPPPVTAQETPCSAPETAHITSSSAPPSASSPITAQATSLSAPETAQETSSSAPEIANATPSSDSPSAPPPITAQATPFSAPETAQETLSSAPETVHATSSSDSPFAPPMTTAQATSFSAPVTVHATSSSAEPSADIVTAHATSNSTPVTAHATSSSAEPSADPATAHTTSSSAEPSADPEIGDGTLSSGAMSSMEVAPASSINPCDDDDLQASLNLAASILLDELETEVLPCLEVVIEKLDEYIETIPRTVSAQEMEERLQAFQARVDVDPFPSWYSLMKKSNDAFWENLTDYFICEALEDDDDDDDEIIEDEGEEEGDNPYFGCEALEDDDEIIEDEGEEEGDDPYFECEALEDDDEIIEDDDGSEEGGVPSGTGGGGSGSAPHDCPPPSSSGQP